MSSELFELIQVGEHLPYHPDLLVKRGFRLDFSPHDMEGGWDATIRGLPPLDALSFNANEDWNAAQRAYDRIAEEFENVAANSSHELHQWLERVPQREVAA